MSHLFDAHHGLTGFHGPAVSRLPQLAALLKLQNSVPETRQPGSVAIDVNQLYGAVSRVFCGADHVLFDVSAANVPAGAALAGEPDARLRIDAPSGRLSRPASFKRLFTALGLAKAKETLRAEDWVVLVADETTLDLEQAALLLEQFERTARFLLIWCGPPAPAATPGTFGDAIAPAAQTIGGSREASYDGEALEAALRQIKAQSTAAVLDLRLQPAFLEPFLPGDAPAETAQFPALQNRQAAGRVDRAVQSLVRLAAADPRIVAVSLGVDDALGPFAADFADRYFEIPTGDADALAWCAGLAAGGCRPVICASPAALARSWPALSAEICEPQHAVKLVLLADGDSATGSARNSLGLLQLLPHAPLLVPRDGGELDQMLEFAMAYGGPACVWCGDADLEAGPEPDAAAQRSRIQFGRADFPQAAADVALIAWGTTTRAAERAAIMLAGVGVKATVLNARFLAPLDAAAICQCAAAAQTCVVLDDARWQAGFAPRALAALAAGGAATPTSVLQAQAAPAGLNVRLARDHFALQIFERCSWLSAPVVRDVPVETDGTTLPVGASNSVHANWLQFFDGRSSQFAHEREQVAACRLSDDARRWVAAYETVGSRDVYLWRWCLHGVELTTLPCVAPELVAHACDTKLLSIVLCVLLDDVADQHGQGHLLETLLELTSWGQRGSLAGLTCAERRHAELTRALWEEYLDRLATYPCFGDYEQLLRYDLRQFFNTMRYSHLLNSQPGLMNMAEHDLYTSHNMMMVSFATIDLMCSAGFPPAEVGTLREAVWHAQCMGRIGNLLSTWRREIADHDFTSGVFARAVMEGDLTLDELQHGDRDDIERAIRAGGHEAYFYRQWQEHRGLCHARARRVASLDLRQTLAGHDRFLAMHLGSQGLI